MNKNEGWDRKKKSKQSKQWPLPPDCHLGLLLPWRCLLWHGPPDASPHHLSAFIHPCTLSLLLILIYYLGLALSIVNILNCKCNVNVTTGQNHWMRINKKQQGVSFTAFSDMLKQMVKIYPPSMETKQNKTYISSILVKTVHVPNSLPLVSTLTQSRACRVLSWAGNEFFPV